MKSHTILLLPPSCPECESSVCPMYPRYICYPSVTKHLSYQMDCPSIAVLCPSNPYFT